MMPGLNKRIIFHVNNKVDIKTMLYILINGSSFLKRSE